MIWIALPAAAFLLGLERVTYWYAWTRPERFAAWLGRVPGRSCSDPVAGLERMFYGFKVIQFAVLAGWCMLFAQDLLPLPTAPPGVIAAGLVLLALGQLLNFSVIWRLGSEAMFYGNRFGRPIQWQTGFPFSLLPHPQYLGAGLSVWAVMLIMRYPNPDWIALPLVSTAFYVWGANFEQD